MKTKKLEPEEEEQNQIEVRNKLVDELIGSSFQLSATGTVFTIGSDSNPGWNDVIFCLNRLYTTGYVEEYKLLPQNVPPAILVSGLAKDTVAWLVPMIIREVDRKTLSGSIDILSPNNKTLVRLMDVLGWYWYHQLHGPKPVLNATIKVQRSFVVQNAALVCPLCYHQFIPAESYRTQSDKAFAFVAWLPTHLVHGHGFRNTKKITGAKCMCGSCKAVHFTGDASKNKKLVQKSKGGTK